MGLPGLLGEDEDGNGHPCSALLLVPGYTFCSGTLIDEDVVLAAGHCTSFLTDAGISEVWVAFDPYASVDAATWEPTGGTWYLAHSWTTHPDYVAAAWPFAADYGLAFLDGPVAGITPAALPATNVLDDLTGTTGQIGYRMGYLGRLCSRMTSLNHRVDLPVVLDWIDPYVDWQPSQELWSGGHSGGKPLNKTINLLRGDKLHPKKVVYRIELASRTWLRGQLVRGRAGSFTREHLCLA